MKEDQLKRGIELQKLIKEHKQALLCFEYDNNCREDLGEDLLPPDIISTNPKLIIEYDAFDDDHYRATRPVPMVLSDFLIKNIKDNIQINLTKLEKEFNDL